MLFPSPKSYVNLAPLLKKLDGTSKVTEPPATTLMFAGVVVDVGAVVTIGEVGVDGPGVT